MPETMSRIEAGFLITTPMFAGREASGETESMGAELRPTAIKAALRFWWRALKWAEFPGRMGDAQALATRLKEEEDALFGAVATDRKGGQAAFQLRLDNTAGSADAPTACAPGARSDRKLFSRDVAGEDSIAGPGVDYLGYGCISWEKRLKGTAAQRAWLPEGQAFSIQLLCRPERTIQKNGKSLRIGCTEAQRAELVRALTLFGLLGGLGARVRRGFGSVALQRLTVDGESRFIPPDSPATYRDRVREALGLTTEAVLPGGTPPWTAFCGPAPELHRGTLCAVVDPDCSALGLDAAWDPCTGLDVLEMLGRAMLLYRSHGRNGKLTFSDASGRKQTARQDFKDDHDWFKRLKPFPSEFHPERVAFGLPHNYFSQSSGADEKAFVELPTDSLNRRASPLVLHVHRIGDAFIGVVVVLPGCFLPDDQKIVMKRPLLRNEPDRQVSPHVDWSVLYDFVDKPTGPRQSPFAQRTYILGEGR